MNILKLAQSNAMKIIENDPKLKKKENKLLKDLVKDKFTNRIEI